MRHYLMHKYFLEPVSDDDRQTIVVPAHIEDRIGRHVIGRVKKLSNVVKVPEFGVLHD